MLFFFQWDRGRKKIDWNTIFGYCFIFRGHVTVTYNVFNAFVYSQISMNGQFVCVLWFLLPFIFVKKGYETCS